MAVVGNQIVRRRAGGPIHWIRLLGSAVIKGITFVGGMSILLGQTFKWTWRGLFRRKVRFSHHHLIQQMIRVGVRSIPIVLLVQFAIGFILALQMAPELDRWGQAEQVASINAIAGFRELGPLMAAIVLSGFAGASIAAELGTMVTTEEIEALQVQAINPVRFLVVPRVLATVIMMLCLTVLADLTLVFGGFITGVLQLGISPARYYHLTLEALTNKGFLTGLIKGGLFGLLISLIACYQGLSVKPADGSEGVGRATTVTVVRSIVAIVIMDAILTALFYVYNFFER
ncbi:MAG: ABC transporter permease [Actinobacteria bacterium]|nr:ABC transporter permease [Actinomycetota bacterium]